MLKFEVFIDPRPKKGEKEDMSNLATLAPPITRETAPDMARRATASRVARIAREKAEERQRDIEARALAIERETKPDPDDARKLKVQKQIDILLNDMKGASLKDRLSISRTLADLWKLVQPTAGVSKPVRSQQRAGLPSAVRTPQAAAIPTAENPSKAQ